MTRQQVDRHLWAFSAIKNNAYTGTRPGHSMVDYELWPFGKLARIGVGFDPSGKVDNLIPAFDN